MSVKAADVKALREKTGAGMLDCKKALVEADGDANKAEKILKELGLAAAAKRSDRATKEGRVFIGTLEKKTCAMVISCETDFVARNKDFIALGETLTQKVLADGLTEITDELKEMVTEAISVIKENISLTSFQVMESSDNEYISSYIHGEGSIGVLVKVQAEDAAKVSDEKVKEFAFDAALHVAAFNPMYIDEDAIEDAYKKEQEEIFTKQAESLGKPEKVVVGIVKGKLKKHFSEICFLNQPFVKDDKRSVSQVAADLGKELGTSLKVTEYLYFKAGA